MNDVNIESKYKKYKYIIKQWEKSFKEKYGRVPSKYDIRDASANIKNSYKLYYKLKTTFLENTLNEVLNDELFNASPDWDINNEDNCTNGGILALDNVIDIDNNLCIDENSTSKKENSLKTGSYTNVNELSKSEFINSDNEIILKTFEVDKIDEANLKSWGKHLNKSGSDIINSKAHTPNLEFNISQKNYSEKLFKNTSFTKRNPRKSLLKITSKDDINIQFGNSQILKTELPDLETILVEKSLKQFDKDIKNNSQDNLTIINQIDGGWLERRNDNNFNLKNSTDTTTLNNLENYKNKTTHFGISNLNISKSINCPHDANILIENKYDDEDVIANSEDESTSRQEITLNHIYKKRKLSDDDPEKITNSIVQKSDLEEQQGNNDNDKNDFNNLKTQKTGMRSSKKTVNYVEKISNESEMNSFNDSDHDPDYKCNTHSPGNIKVKTKTKKASKKILKKCKNISKLTKIKRNSNKIDEIQSDKIETNPYSMEYGMEIMQNNPRIDVKELNKNSQIFNEFLSNEIDDLPNAVNKKFPVKNVNVEDSAISSKSKKNKSSLNANFVRININKKNYVRGKKQFNFTKYKKNLWKKKKISAMTGPDMDMGGCDGGQLICFQCGKPGHFSQRCPIKGDKLLDIDVSNDESPHLTLHEVEEMVKLKVQYNHNHNDKKENNMNDDTLNIDGEKDVIDTDNTFIEEIKPKNYIGHVIPEEFLKKCGMLDQYKESNELIEPLYKLQTDDNVIETPNEVTEILKRFGYTNFRAGQEKAIMRILSGLSTLVTLSTGSGKSLCYQLPAFLYRKYRKCIVLVISPLVSLMEDQVHGVPNFLNAQCLHTNQNKTKQDKTMEMIKSGKVDILLVSPEAIVASEKSTGFGSLMQQLPPIAFACIDEAHCVSQWSHNFRPSYLMVCRVLRERLKIKTILGLTATATIQTKKSIVSYLGIPDGLNAVISDIPIPENLILTISIEENRDVALLQLLKTQKFIDFKAIIIYCTRREECERIARLVRTCYQQINANAENAVNQRKHRKRIESIVEAYHAGLSASRRRYIQNDFMFGNLKIVVATIAFGMGINKSDIRSVIHYNMPMTFESYVQEVGRAGRDGKMAHCHVFLDAQCNDQYELRRHVFANSIDRYAIRKLLQKVFVPCACIQNIKTITDKNDINILNKPTHRICPGHEVGFAVESTVQSLDVPEEIIATLLCYMELDENRYIQVLSKAYTTCKIISYAGPSAIKRAAKNCAPLAMAIALDLNKGISHNTSTVIEFPVIEIAAIIGWNSGIVKYQLKNLEWTTTESGLIKRSALSVEFHDLGFRVRAAGDLSNYELDATLELLYSRVVQQEASQLLQLKTVSALMTEYAFNSNRICSKDDISLNDVSEKFKNQIRNYFLNDIRIEFNKNITNNIFEDDDSQIILDIRTMISQYPDNNFTGRSLARIFHGIQSPVYSAVIWSKCKYWRAHLKINFNRIVQLANTEIVKMRT